MGYSQVVSLLLALSSIGFSHPTSNTNPNNPQQVQNNHNQLPSSGDQKPQTSLSHLMHRDSNSNNPPSYVHVQNYDQVANAHPYVRDPPPAASPFLGLTSNGDFQISAYFSQIFWGLAGLIIGIASIIYLIRALFPAQSLDGLVDKFKGTKAGKNLDLDHITNMVYGAIDTYSKWALKDARDGHVNPKRR